MILLVITYMISYHDIPGGSICSSSAAALAHPRRGSGLAATLPRLCGPDSALAETLSPDPLRLPPLWTPSERGPGHGRNATSRLHTCYSPAFSTNHIVPLRFCGAVVPLFKFNPD